MQTRSTAIAAALEAARQMDAPTLNALLTHLEPLAARLRVDSLSTGRPGADPEMIRLVGMAVAACLGAWPVKTVA